MIPMKRLRCLFLAVVMSGIFSLGLDQFTHKPQGMFVPLGKPAKLFKRAQGKKFSVNLDWRCCDAAQGRAETLARGACRWPQGFLEYKADEEGLHLQPHLHRLNT